MNDDVSDEQSLPETQAPQRVARIRQLKAEKAKREQDRLENAAQQAESEASGWSIPNIFGTKQEENTPQDTENLLGKEMVDGVAENLTNARQNLSDRTEDVATFTSFYNFELQRKLAFRMHVAGKLAKQATVEGFSKDEVHSIAKMLFHVDTSSENVGTCHDIFVACDDFGYIYQHVLVPDNFPAVEWRALLLEARPGVNDMDLDGFRAAVLALYAPIDTEFYGESKRSLERMLVKKSFVLKALNKILQAETTVSQRCLVVWKQHAGLDHLQTYDSEVEKIRVIQKYMTACKEKDVHISQLEAELKKMSADKDEQILWLETEMKALANIRNECTQKTEKMSWLEAELKALEDSRNNCTCIQKTQTISSLQAEVKAASDARLQHTERIAWLEAELKALENAKNEYTQETSRLSTLEGEKDEKIISLEAEVKAASEIRVRLMDNEALVLAGRKTSALTQIGKVCRVFTLSRGLVATRVALWRTRASMASRIQVLEGRIEAMEEEHDQAMSDLQDKHEAEMEQALQEAYDTLEDAQF